MRGHVWKLDKFKGPRVNLEERKDAFLCIVKVASPVEILQMFRVLMPKSIMPALLVRSRCSSLILARTAVGEPWSRTPYHIAGDHGGDIERDHRPKQPKTLKRS